jgi:hypothetical protein
VVPEESGAQGDIDRESIRRLSSFVEGEAKRMFADAQLDGDPELIAEGWKRRFITDRRRADEMVTLYRELGQDVRMEPVHGDLGEDCGDCQLLRLQFCMVYTRNGATISEG